VKPASLPLLLVLVTGCGRSLPPQVERSTPASLEGGDAIMLYRSPCAAGCQVYTLRVTQDGLVSYEGTSGVSRTGTATARVPQARVEGLLEELDGAGYFSFADRYRPSERVCGRYVPDAPTVITSARRNGRIKRIEHDHGCGGAPDALRVLESRIDEALGASRWTGR
jgi:uncharacterized protein DUF6438